MRKAVVLAPSVLLALVCLSWSSQFPLPPTVPTTIVPLTFPSLTPPSLIPSTWVTVPTIWTIPPISPFPASPSSSPAAHHRAAPATTTTTTTTTVTWPASSAMEFGERASGLPAWAVVAIVAAGAAVGFFSTRK